MYTKFGANSEQTDESVISGESPERPRKSKAETAANALFKDKDRKVSTGTLNRLVLVAQLLLVLINVLLFTGFGKYQDHRESGYKDLLLTVDKWHFDPNSKDLPATFALMQLHGQYLAASITVFLLISTVALQVIHVCSAPSSRVTNMCYSFGAVPFSLFVFGLEMHYSTCPWVDDYYFTHNKAYTQDMTAQCAINGWALAGIFSLLSCGLFVGEGLITAFFRSEVEDFNDGKETVL